MKKYKKSAIVIFSIALFIFSNIFILLVSLRVDLSSGKAYTLSDSTRKMVNKLDKELNLDFYISSHLPARLQPLKREIIDVLTEYKRINNKILFTTIDFNPNEDSDTLKKAQELGINPIPVRAQSQSEVSLSEVYIGLAIRYGEKQSALPQIVDLSDLEYNITSAIFQMTQAKLPKIAVVGIPNSTYPQEDNISFFKQYAGRLFDIQNLSSSKLPDPTEVLEDSNSFKLDPSIKTLLVVDNPQNTYSEDELKEIEKYMAYGNSIFMLNGIKIDDNLMTYDSEKGLIGLLNKYGIAIEPNLILSTRSEFVNMGGDGFPLLIPYPLWIWSSDFKENTNILSGISRVTFPWASSVRAIKNANGYIAKEIVFSGKESWEQKQEFNLSPENIPDPKQEDLKIYPLIVESTKKAKPSILAIGSSRFIFNNYLSRQSQNLEFIINLMGNYASDGALSGITKRAVNIYPIPSFPENIQEIFKFANILFLPGLLAIYGIFRLWKRSRS